MPSGIVQAIGKSRSGKPTVTIDGQIYSASKVDLSHLVVGDKIEFDSASSDYNGATIWFLNSFKLTEAAIKYPSASHPVPTNGGVTEGERLTISNWVGAAIQAGLVKDRADLGMWAHAACEAIRSAGKQGEIP